MKGKSTLRPPKLRTESPARIEEWASRFADELVAALTRHDEQILLVLDGYEQAESPSSDALLRQLAERLPNNVRLAIASRRVVQFSLSRALMEGRLRRLDKGQLLFSRDEARAFFGGTLTPAELHSVHTLTEGWPAALTIARACASAWRESRKDIRTLPEFSRLVADYCRTELLAEMDPATATFLVDTAVLETLHPDLCDAVREADDSASLLANLTSRNTLLEPVSIEANSWRVPALLRHVLMWRARERGTAHVAQAHLRAAVWHERTGNIRDAVAHHVAGGRPEAAAATLERAIPMRIAVSRGDEHADALLDLLPERDLLNSTRLSICRAYITFKRGLMEEAELLFEDVKRRTQGFRSGGDSVENNPLLLEGLVMELVIALYRRSAVSLQYVRSLEERTAACGKGEHLLLSLAHIALGLMYEVRGDLEAASSHLIQADQLNVKDQGGFQALWNIHHHGSISLARGQLMDARYLFHSGLKIWRKSFRFYRSYGPLVDLFLAEIDYENGAFADAQNSVQPCTPRSIVDSVSSMTVRSWM